MNAIYRSMIENALRKMNNDEYIDAENEIKRIVIVERDRRGLSLNE